MNYLAHAYLAGNEQGLLLGNFIADGLPGSKINHLPREIQLGVLMHRQIDSFTDAHPINAKARSLFYTSAGKFAGVVLDIIYDHILAKNWAQYHNLSLDSFVNNCYLQIEQNKNILPEKVAYMFPYMRQYNWLLNYGSEQGIMRSLEGLSKRIASKPKLPEAGIVAFNNLAIIQACFDGFFPELRQHCELWILNQKE